MDDTNTKPTAPTSMMTAEQLDALQSTETAISKLLLTAAVNDWDRRFGKLWALNMMIEVTARVMAGTVAGGLRRLPFEVRREVIAHAAQRAVDYAEGVFSAAPEEITAISADPAPTPNLSSAYFHDRKFDA